MAGGIIGHLAGHGSAPTEMPNVGADPRVCPTQADLIGLRIPAFRLILK